MAEAVQVDDAQATGHISGIPVRNLWLLMLYASDLFRQLGATNVSIEENPDEIADLVAEVLAHVIERRLRRNLSLGYRSREAALSRVRGHIDVLATERRLLLARGKVACRFDDLTVNTPRNRFARAALVAIARVVRRTDLAVRCTSLANSLKQLGVSGERPTLPELSTDRLGRHDSDDRSMIAAAKLAFDLALPTEMSGRDALLSPDREIMWIRRLYERAIGGFYRVVLEPRGWRVDGGQFLNWSVEEETSGVARILPSMKTDIVLEHDPTEHRVVIDTKFTSILTAGWYREETLKSGYIYQIYTYLRSQECPGDPWSEHSSGLLLHPCVGEMIDEIALIQGHAIRFATVDLAATAAEIREQLLHVVQSGWLGVVSGASGGTHPDGVFS